MKPLHNFAMMIRNCVYLLVLFDRELVKFLKADAPTPSHSGK